MVALRECRLVSRLRHVAWHSVRRVPDFAFFIECVHRVVDFWDSCPAIICPMESNATEPGLPHDELLEQICEDERADILQRLRDLASTDQAGAMPSRP